MDKSDKSKVTRDQQRAQTAYDSVLRVHDSTREQKWKEGYGRQCLRLPALIHECGLCQTVAFLESKAKGKQDTYFYQVLTDLAITSRPSSAVEVFSEKVRSSPMKGYQWMTREAMVCAQWLKRYAEAILKVDPTEGGD